MYELTREDRDAFGRDGFLLLRNIVPKATIDEIRGVFGGVVDRQANEWLEEGRIPERYETEPFETRYARMRDHVPATFSNSWKRIIVSEPVYRLWQLPELLALMRPLLGDELYAHATFNGRPRVPGQLVQTIDWHQDAHYYPEWSTYEWNILSCWMPLVPVDGETGCLQVLPGYHTGGIRPRVKLPRNNLVGLADSELEGFEPFTCVMNPGDVLIFGPLIAHRATDNNGPNVRWSIDIRFAPYSESIAEHSKRGYVCHSAANPERVESFESWAAKYDYEGEF